MNTSTTDPLPSPMGEDDKSRGNFFHGKKSQTSTSRTIIEWIVLVLAALVVAFLLRTFVVQAFYIPSESMVPTLKVGDRVLVNKFGYHLHDPHRGDIVVFKAPPSEKSKGIKDLVKRVIGLPGEKIEGKNGRIYINGKLIAEKYLPPGTPSKTFGPVTVPADSYYMLGDNRPESQDSTFFGPIKRSQFVGKVFLRVWPLNHLTIF